MTQHSWKSSDLIEVKANFHRHISRIIFFIKTAVSINNSLDPGPQAHVGLHHGVPVEGPQHLLHLLDQILGFIARLFNDPYLRFALHKIAKRVAIRLARRPDLLLLHLRNRKASKTQSRSSCFLRQGSHRAKRSNDDFQLSKCILRHQFSKFVKHFFTIVNSALVDGSKALNHYMIYISSAESGDSLCSYALLLIHLCWNVTVCL